MIGLKSLSQAERTKKFLSGLLNGDLFSDLDRYGRMGVDALAKNTPEETGLTANSWEYKVIRGSKPGIYWYNTNQNQGANVAILLQYGHGTGTGGYVTGKDYVNPSMDPVFKKISEDVRRKVRRG